MLLDTDVDEGIDLVDNNCGMDKHAHDQYFQVDDGESRRRRMVVVD